MMSELLEELVAHGFEIVKDETGQDLVKLVLMDENDEATGYALVSPEDAKRILSGQATLQNVLDDDGKQVLTLTTVENDEAEPIDESTAQVLSTDDTTEPTDANAAVTHEEPEVDAVTAMETDEAMDANPASTPPISEADKIDEENNIVEPSQDAADAETIGEGVEQFVLSEQTVIVDDKSVQVVTLMDARGEMIDQKQGEVGEQVVLEIHGQMFSYELQGASDTGEPITSTLLVSSAEADGEEPTDADAHPDEAVQSAASTIDQSAAADAQGDAENDATPAGQQFTLTEAMAMADGEPIQAVIVTDEIGNVLDQKYGQVGEHVIIELGGTSLEYVFLGPTENGEPITTTLVVTTDPDAVEAEQTDDATDAVLTSDAAATAADWCPPGLTAEMYTVVCHQVENIVTTRIMRHPDGSSPYRPEAYNRKLGSPAMYQQMTELSNSYNVGSSRGETLARYECLRNLSKIYRASGPQSRALTNYEVAMNEAAAQLCRHHPGLLFHKRELFHLAKETVEQAQSFLTATRRLQQQQRQQSQQHTPQLQQSPLQVDDDMQPRSSGTLTGTTMTAGKVAAVSAATGTQPVVSTAARGQPPRTMPQPTEAVGGQVASSQLAMLESRGFTGAKQMSMGMNTPNLPAFSAVSNEVDMSGPDQAATPSRQSLPDTSYSFYSGISAAKREASLKLTPAQEEAIRAAAVDVIMDLHRYDLKPRVDCTNIEAACWEQAKQLCAQTPLLHGQCLADGESMNGAAGAAGMLQSSIHALMCNDKRLHAVRDASVIYGRPVPLANAASAYGNNNGGSNNNTPRSSPLLQSEVASNEASAYLVAAVPQLLTHRRDLSELAKKVVRQSGCLFYSGPPGPDKITLGSGGYRFYSDQLPELDLSAADQLLTDPLDRSDSPDSGCGLSSTEAETVTSNFQSMTLSCEECNNVIDDVTIYTTTGTDSLKKVRILNLSNCAFTGMIPMHLNQCVNMIELNLADNALSAFPRCLHLAKLKRLNLRGNRRLQLHSDSPTGKVEPPLVEQFPRLASLELDAPLVELLSRQSLACLCPYLRSINGEEFTEEPSEDTIKAIQAAKHQLSTLIYSKWEDDISGFYKKGLPKRDTIRVIETLVLHAIKHSVDVGEPFSHCKSILARRVAEDFLSPKMLDDELEDDTAEKIQHSRDYSDEDDDEDEELEEDEIEIDDHVDSDVDDEETTGKPRGLKADMDGAGVVDLKPNTKKSLAGPRSRKSKKPISAEAHQASVAQREAEAAAANLALLPDEPPDRLINVVGQAMRHGKTVIYAVIRTAARQPNGELIPVGGGLGITSSSAGTNPSDSHMNLPITTSATSKGSRGARSIQAQYEDEMTSDIENTVPATGSKKKQSKQAKQPTGGSKKQSQPAKSSTGGRSSKSTKTPAQSRQSITATTPAASAASGAHSRRPGVLTSGGGRSAAKKSAQPATPSTHASGITTSSSKTGETVYTIPQRRLLPSDYIIRPSQSSSQPALVVPNISVQPKPVEPPTPVRRGGGGGGGGGRPSTTHSVTKKAAAAKADAAETSKLIQHLTIPPPHAPPPSTMRMSTRDTNRLKRFSVYGVIDTAAAHAGKEHALLAAALAVEDERESIAARNIMQQSAAVVLSAQDSALAEKARASLDGGTINLSQTPIQTRRSVGTKSEPPSDGLDSEIVTGAKKRKRRQVTLPGGDSPSGIEIEELQMVQAKPITTASPAGRKRTPGPASPRRAAPQQQQVKPAPTYEDEEVTVLNSTRSLTDLGGSVDYDPLHFIRCHARDNDPLDCTTKVWRCVFEPSVANPRKETSNVVATCGGECVCLIDCRSGRVMKRFKHLGEEFYSLAWTTVEMAAGHRTNLLAAAGKLREIRLLHPEQLVCYAEMRGHKEDIACMNFHPTRPTVLFSGDSRASILVWDIGIPAAPEYRTRHQLLMRLVCPRPNLNPVLNLIYLPKFESLVAGCEDGVFSWTFSDFRKEKGTEEREPDVELKIPTRSEPCFDGLAKVSDSMMIVKCVEEGEIYAIDFAQIAQRSKRMPANKKLTVEIRGQLRWQTTEEIYINVTACSKLNAVICGDNEGTIWLYDLQKQIVDEHRRFKAKPIKILEWPECSIGGTREDDSQLKETITSGFKNPVVNTTDLSHDGQYLVAVTDNNLVCIWKFSG